MGKGEKPVGCLEGIYHLRGLLGKRKIGVDESIGVFSFSTFTTRMKYIFLPFFSKYRNKCRLDEIFLSGQ